MNFDIEQRGPWDAQDPDGAPMPSTELMTELIWISVGPKSVGPVDLAHVGLECDHIIKVQPSQQTLWESKAALADY